MGRFRGRDFLYQIIFVAILYFVLGHIGLKLFIPKHYEHIFFPSAGLALVAVLHGNLKLLPGVFLGALSLNLSIDSEITSATMGLALVVATAVCIQAWLGSYTIKKYTTLDWKNLKEGKDIVRFYLIGGPISCLIYPTINYFVSYCFFNSDINPLVENWLLSWIGGSLGVILLAPLLLTILYRNEEIWHNRLYQLLLPTIISIFIFIAFYSYTLNNKNTKIAESIEMSGLSIINKISSKINSYEEIISSISRMKSISPNFSYIDFKKFTLPIFKENQDLQALSWNPYILANEKITFEKKLSTELKIPNLKIFQINRTTISSASDNNDFFMPIAYISPEAENIKAIGYDIASNPVRLAAIKQAILTQKAAMTAPISLVQETGTSAGVLIINPLFRLGTDILEGVSVGVIRMQNIMSDILQINIDQGLKILIEDKYVVDGNNVLFKKDKENTDYDTQYLWERDISINGRTWKITILPSSSYIFTNQSLTPWSVLFLGILLSIALQTFLLILTGRNHTFYEKLKLSASVFDNAHEGIMITDTDGIIVDVNPKFSDITGYQKTEVIGLNANILTSDRQSDLFYDEMWSNLVHFGHWQGEISNVKKNGDLFIELLTISSIADYRGKRSYYVGLFSDITLNKAQQQTLELMAHYDPLTGLPNRVLFIDRAQQAMTINHQNNTLLAFCFLDIDNFKKINDTYGHHIGDQLLTEIAYRIKSCIHAEDTVSRLGGDEFTILLRNLTSKNDCIDKINTIFSSLATPFKFKQITLTITTSCGITLYPIDNTSLDTLIRHADQAMYKAKLAGRNQYQFFDLSYDLDTTQKYIHLKEIAKALDLNQFTLYYQPKVNMATGHIFGLEALIRWNHPTKGLVSPAEFLPLIEGSDVELHIGNWVIDQALRQMQAWADIGIKLEVSVNISSYHLESLAFTESLAEKLRAYPLVCPGNIQLEILETSSLGDLNKVNHILRTCHEQLGVQIALDDFGTGYSSLTHLSNLISQTIKIDQSFIRNMLDDPNNFSIIDGIIGLTEAFNRDTIAEGVETTEHGLMLLSMGCICAQGYHIARPMPASEFPEWLFNYSPNLDWIDFANNEHSARATMLFQMHLVAKRWYSLLEMSLTAMEYKLPILDPLHCLFAALLARATKEQLFDNVELVRLDKAHVDLHRHADIAMSFFLSEQYDDARETLISVNSIYHNLDTILNELA
jgi:diguanylate cyclase (GGDEF)-like protein/PAS domain S-box-containing protein